MATPYKITGDAFYYIKANCQLTSAQLRQDLWDKFHVDVSEVAVWEHVKKARDEAEAATRCADAHISKKIAERVDEKVLDLMKMSETEILKLYDTLQGTETNIGIKPDYNKDGNPTGKLSSKDYAAIEKLFQDSVKNYVALRPQIQTVKIEGLGTRAAEDAFLATLDDSETMALESMIKKREKFLEENAGSEQ